MKYWISLRERFWKRFHTHPAVRRLRPRLMTMVLVLVLPCCLMCILISAGAIVQGSRLVYTNGKNTFGMYMAKVVLREEYEGIDPLDDFPSVPARDLSSLVAPVDSYKGSLYVSADGHKAWRILPDGGYTAETEDFGELLKRRWNYAWQSEEAGFEVLVVFPYNFALRYIPKWFWIGFVLAALTLLFCPLLYRQLRTDVLIPMDIVEQAMEQLKEDRTYRIPPQSLRYSDEFLRSFEAFNKMSDELEAAYEKELKLLETEMENLRLQVNPHMLLNSYNMIYALAESKKYEVIQDYALCLVDYFRYVLRRGQKVVTVRQELEFVDNFIRIQRIRFPGRFSYVYQAEGCYDGLIPPLLIENFVENSIKYALEPGEAIEIIVSVRREKEADGAEFLHISITDTGSGIRPEVLRQLEKHEPYVDEMGNRHIGIYNCFRRIELFYGKEGKIHFSSSLDKGTQAYLVVPFRTVPPETEGSVQG